MGTPTPADRSLRVAAVVSSILALPGIAGFVGLVQLALVMGSYGDPTSSTNLPTLLGILAALAVPPVGFYLLVGYWRAVRGSAPARNARRFWWLSAGYNGAGAALAAGGVLMDVLGWGVLGYFWLAALTVGWTVFMVRLSISYARQSPMALSQGPIDRI